MTGVRWRRKRRPKRRLMEMTEDYLSEMGLSGEGAKTGLFGCELSSTSTPAEK